MKKGILILAFVACCASCPAQQAIFEKPDVVSPVIDENGDVTFSLYAPKAETVAVTGDFAGSPLSMTRDSLGVWSATITSMSPEIYIYQYLVDGAKFADPSNPYTKRDTSTVYSLLYVNGDLTDGYAVKDVPHGTVSKVWYNSPSLDMQRRMSVYTPAGYGADDRRYPVLYLLHGMGGDEEAWLTLGRAAQILDNLIAKGLAEPMIVVMPNGNVDLPSAPGEGPAGFVRPTTKLPHTMEGNYEKTFMDIVNYVDSAYNTRTDKASRAVAGLSMGGFNALNISALYPDKFDYVGLFSAAINPRANENDSLFAGRDELLARQFADQPTLYWIGIGDSDFLYDENKKYRAMLTLKGYPYVYNETDGGHSWKNWRKYLNTFAPLLFKK